MKLSDKLAAHQQQASSEATTGDEDRSARGRGRGRSLARDRAGSGRANRAPAAGQERNEWAEQKQKVRQLVLDELTPKLSGSDGQDEQDLGEEVIRTLDRIVSREDVTISPASRRKFVSELLDDILGYGPLGPLLEDPDVTEIMCNSHSVIWIERRGRLEQADVEFVDEDQYRRIIDRIVSRVGRRVDEASPMVDARLPDGSRVNVIVPPLALAGAAMTIRRFPEDPLTIPGLVKFEALSENMALLLEACVHGKLNILVSGGTGSGKTTMLNALSGFIPEGERILTIEDAAELQLQQPHVVSLESRPANAEGSGEVNIRDLVRNSLRMRPDRIVVGEVRGPEALDMLQAMNTGHEGSLTTIHSNGPRDALSRLETLVLMAELDLPERAIREQIVGALDLLVHLERLPDGQRKITSVQEVAGLEGTTILLQEIFAYEPEVGEDGRYLGAAEATGLRPRFLEELKSRNVQVPADLFLNRPAPSPAGQQRWGGR